MQQSWVDIFEVMYCLTPAKGGGHTCFIDTSEVPCVYEVQKLSNIAMCTKYMAEQLIFHFCTRQSHMESYKYFQCTIIQPIELPNTHCVKLMDRTTSN